MSSFGKNIKALRQQKNRTLREVSAFLNLPANLLDKIETGQINATKTQVFHLASYLGLDQNKMLAAYLEDLVLQTDQAKEVSKRVENISCELTQLRSRQIQANIYKPSSPLDSIIESIIYYDGNNKIHPYERKFPNGSMQLVIELDGNERTLVPNDIHSHLSLKKAWIEGVQKKHSTYRIKQNETTLSIRFTTGGFYVLTDIPATEIKNSFFDAEIIFGSAISLLREQLLACSEISVIFQVVERFFLEKIPSQNKDYSVINYITNNIDAPMSELAQKTGYSHKHMIRLFKKYAGISPKYFHRIYRFNKTLNDILATAQRVNWQNIVFGNGYYDQSHFIKEFNHFSGLNPSTYLETGSTCSKLLHLSKHR